MAEARAKKRLSAHVAADRIHSAAIRLLRNVRRQDTLTGVSPARLSALSVLVFQGPLSLGALAETEQVKPPTMSRIVDGLVASGLARRSESPEDGRAWRIEATAKGRLVLKRGRERRVSFLAERLDMLTSHELVTLVKAADIIQRVMKSSRPAGA